MLKVWSVFMTMAMLAGVGSVAWAQEDKAKAADAPKPTVAQLQAQLHRTVADLIEARAQEKPDKEQIDKLVGQVKTLREQLIERRSEAALDAPCPWGGPGLGRGAGYGFGPGRGMGYGRGPGYGRGAGWGAAQGFPGRAFVDRDGDGVCDNYELRQNQ